MLTQARYVVNMTQPTARDIDFDAVVDTVEKFILTHFDQADDTTLPRLWAWACVMEYCRDYGFTVLCDAVDLRGFTHQECADALGVSRQAVQQRMMRGNATHVGDAPKSRPKQREQLPLQGK